MKILRRVHAWVAYPFYWVALRFCNFMRTHSVKEYYLACANRDPEESRRYWLAREALWARRAAWCELALEGALIDL